MSSKRGGAKLGKNPLAAGDGTDSFLPGTLTAGAAGRSPPLTPDIELMAGDPRRKAVGGKADSAAGQDLTLKEKHKPQPKKSKFSDKDAEFLSNNLKNLLDQLGAALAAQQVIRCSVESLEKEVARDGETKKIRSANFQAERAIFAAEETVRQCRRHLGEETATAQSKIAGLLVGAGGEKMLVPVVDVVEVLRLSDEVKTAAVGCPVLHHRGQLLAWFDLSQVLGLNKLSEISSVPRYGVILTAGQERIVMAVEALLGRREVFCTPLDWGLSGAVRQAAIIEGEKIALLLDTGRLVALVQKYWQATRCDHSRT